MRVVTFADGFVSTTPPVLDGEVSANYSLLNNQSSPVNISDFIIGSSSYKSAFISYEIERIGASTYRQVGSLIAVFNGTWSITFGNFQGDGIFSDTIVNSENVVLSINASTGQFSYTSGNLPGHTSSKLKIYITKVLA
jgi:hypothetical protein